MNYVVQVQSVSSCCQRTNDTEMVSFGFRFCAMIHVNRKQLAMSYAQSKKEAKRRAAEEAMLEMMAYEKVIAHRT